jgi:hypothetical protein
LVAAEEAYLGCLANCGLHKHHSFISSCVLHQPWG